MESFLIPLVVLVFSAVLHEVAHGFVADRLGDPTARLSGRLTLNPLPHIDPLMSVIIPFILIILSSPIIFGAAKPVPVNPLMLKEGRKDLALVALSGPATNLLIALVGAILIQIISFSFQAEALISILKLVVFLNLALGFLNLIPIPPLDGSKFFTILLPEKSAQQYLALAPFGIFILFMLILYTPLGSLLYGLIITTAKLLGVSIFS